VVLGDLVFESGIFRLVGILAAAALSVLDQGEKSDVVPVIHGVGLAGFRGSGEVDIGGETTEEG
jgi:hypothetical protein